MRTSLIIVYLFYLIANKRLDLLEINIPYYQYFIINII